MFRYVLAFLLVNGKKPELLISLTGFTNIEQTPSLIRWLNVSNPLDPIAVVINLHRCGVTKANGFVVIQKHDQLRRVFCRQGFEFLRDDVIVKVIELATHIELYPIGYTPLQ